MRIRVGEPVLAGVVLAALGVVVIGSVLAIGGVHLPVLAAVAVVATLAAGFALRLPRARVPGAACVVLLLGGYTLLQAVPLPVWALARIAPANADVWSRALLPLGSAGPAWASVSLDPGASVIEALKWSVYAAVLTAAYILAQRRGPTAGVALVFGSAVAAAMVTLVHSLVGAEKVFGLYQPRFRPAPWHVGPLLNPNNLAGYLGMGSLCGLGLLTAHRPVMPRWAIAIGVALTIAVSVTSASRGGLLALPFGVLCLATLLGVLRRRRRLAKPRFTHWVSLVTVLGGAALALVGATSNTWREMTDRNLQKLELLGSVAGLVRQHPWLGVGRGAFESVFPAYAGAPGNVVYSHAESFPADWVAGWGLPVGGLALLLLVALLRPSRLGACRSAVAAGAWCGLATLLLQNLADLGLEVPAVSIAAAVLLGSLLGGRERHVGTHPTTRLWGGARGSVVVALANGALLCAALVFGRQDVATDRARLHARFEKLDGSPQARAALRRELRAAMLRHPAEPYLPFLGALIAWTGKDQDPVPWLARALERDVTNGRAHLLLAEVLHARGAHVQALLELRLALQDDPDLARAAASRALRWTARCEDLQRIVPEGSAGSAALGALAALIGPPFDSACRERLLREAVDRKPGEPWPHAMLAELLIEQMSGDSTSARCREERRATCEAEVERHAKAVESALPGTSDALRIRAKARSRLGRHQEAEAMLASGCSALSGHSECFLLRVQIAAETSPPVNLPKAIKDFLSISCQSATECARANEAVASVLAKRGDWATATTYFARAAEEAPTEARWLALAEAASRCGSHTQSLQALERVAALRGGADHDLQQRIAAERERALQGLQRPLAPSP